MLKSTVNFLRSTAGRSKGSSISSVMAVVALGWDARRIRLDNDFLLIAAFTPLPSHKSQARCIIRAKRHITPPAGNYEQQFGAFDPGRVKTRTS
jgi:hypothetical protein